MNSSYTEQNNKTAEAVARLKAEIDAADAVVIGAGAGLSTSAGFLYTGERFEKYFPDFIRKYRFEDMYSGGFQVMQLPPGELWAYWSRYIYINRYMDPPKSVYRELFELVKEKDYFVLTTNVDHCFQKAGFDKHRLFYTQGDYGLWQCSRPCHQKTYDNEETVRSMVLAQGFAIAEDGALTVPEGAALQMTVPPELVPRCPVCGEPMRMNLRADDTFVEDDGWHAAAQRYSDFLRRHSGLKVLFLEAGVGWNTPGIIKYPFWRMTRDEKDAVYACLNYSEAYAPDEIAARSICIDGDIGEILAQLK
ncbi:MAG: Sir2 silent information regulator family NAD-dependent deacetylase [Firmicutes bacterium]|nr:Sir2 silent information regulator family NAD-dependent deacetylase [Bacillota bacterium]MBQ6295015.1 Sir2 silent information regulator family NAD-dependent deacetylase [Bacillota bacterium]